MTADLQRREHAAALPSLGLSLSRWASNVISGLARLLLFFFNGSPLKEIKWDRLISPT